MGIVRLLTGVVALALFIAPSCLMAQGLPPGGTPYLYAIVVDDIGNGGKVRGLKYKANANALTHAIPNHEVSYTLKVVPLNGSPTPSSYHWIPSPPLPPEGQFDEGLLVFLADTGSWKCTGYAWSPGEKIATCVIEAAGAPAPMAITTNVLVIGGPLRGAASGSFLRRTNDDFLIDTAVPQDSDKTWHAQIFANQGEPVVKEQVPQTITIHWEQLPDGGTIEFDWTLPGFVADPNYPEASQEGWVTVSSLDLKGTEPGGPGTIACKMKATWTDMHDTTHVGEADDTTAHVHGTTAWYSNKITVHKPTSIVVATSTLGNHLGGLPGYHAAKEHYVMLVRNQNGVGIPGVVVQERFPGTMPPNFRVNEETYWKTTLGATKSFKIWAPNWPDHGQFKTLTVGDGSFHVFDNLAYFWSGNEPSWETVHQYWAGTSDTTIGARGVGLTLLNWTMTFTADGTLGNRGTVTHSGG
jgi:hypothetical protein